MPGISVSSKPLGAGEGSSGPDRTGTPGFAAAAGAAEAPAAWARARLNAATSSASMGS